MAAKCNAVSTITSAPASVSTTGPFGTKLSSSKLPATADLPTTRSAMAGLPTSGSGNPELPATGYAHAIPPTVAVRTATATAATRRPVVRRTATARPVANLGPAPSIRSAASILPSATTQFIVIWSTVVSCTVIRSIVHSSAITCPTGIRTPTTRRTVPRTTPT